MKTFLRNIFFNYNRLNGTFWNDVVLFGDPEDRILQIAIWAAFFSLIGIIIEHL